MPHSLRVRLKNLQRKGELTEKDIDRIFKALEKEPCKECEHNDGECCRILFERSFEQEPSEDMPCITPEEMQKCKDVVKKYTPKQEPCDDVVSRQAVLDAIRFGISNIRAFNDTTMIRFYEHENEALKKAIERVNELPSVRPQEQTGHWIKSKDGYMRCDKCGSRGSAIKARFCHHCGARMVEPTCDTCKYNTATFMPCNACDNKSLFEPQESEG